MRRTLLSSVAVVLAVGFLALVVGLGVGARPGPVSTTNAAIVPVSTGSGSSITARFESRTELVSKPGKGLWLVVALLASVPLAALVAWSPHRRLELVVTGHSATTRATTRAPPSLPLARP